jgi:ElaB/YqjD/DUF883 family membrane-anchored ribosome-binding protein
MTGSTGMPSTDTKPTDAVAQSATSRPDTAAASTTETTKPSAEKILETGPEEIGAPTPAANSPVSPTTGTGASSAGIGGVVEPSLPPKTLGGTMRSTQDISSGFQALSSQHAGTRTGGGAAEYQRHSDQAHEIAERVKLDAIQAGDVARSQGLRGIRTMESFVRENAAASLLAALATGLVLGALLSRSKQGQGSSRRIRDYNYNYDYDDENSYHRDYYYD